MQLKPTPEEIERSKQKLDSIMLEVEKGEMTFREAAFLHSVDKYTKFNAGRLMDDQTGEDKIEKSRLPASLLTELSKLKDGDISTAFEDEFNRQRVIRVIKLEETIPAHKISMETDYARLKNLTINTKRQETVMKYVEEQISDIFIKINDEYLDCDFRLDWKRADK